MAPCLVLASRKLWSRERWDVVAAGEVVVVDLIWWSNGWRVGEESWLMLGAVLKNAPMNTTVQYRVF
jgi:hypothetical protein